MSRQNKVNPDHYKVAGRLSPDDLARERRKQSELHMGPGGRRAKKAMPPWMAHDTNGEDDDDLDVGDVGATESEEDFDYEDTDTVDFGAQTGGAAAVRDEDAGAVAAPAAPAAPRRPAAKKAAKKGAAKKRAAKKRAAKKGAKKGAARKAARGARKGAAKKAGRKAAKGRGAKKAKTARKAKKR